MLTASQHTLALYAGCAVALVAALAARRRGWSPSFAEALGASAPFAVLMSLEVLALRANGKLVAEWLLPWLSALAVLVVARDRVIARRCRVGLVVLAVALWADGNVILTRGYVTRPRTPRPGERLVSGWYTPLTGYRKVCH